MLLFREIYESGLVDECAIMIDDKGSHEKQVVKLKEEYFPPTLTNYGCISKLTRGGMYAGSDGQSDNACNPGNPASNENKFECS
jgi:hypothetical protein